MLHRWSPVLFHEVLVRIRMIRFEEDSESVPGTIETHSKRRPVTSNDGARVVGSNARQAVSTQRFGGAGVQLLVCVRRLAHTYGCHEAPNRYRESPGSLAGPSTDVESSLTDLLRNPTITPSLSVKDPFVDRTLGFFGPKSRKDAGRRLPSHGLPLPAGGT